MLAALTAAAVLLPNVLTLSTFALIERAAVRRLDAAVRGGAAQ